ncbi:MAG TPA: 50S ribosomal protein L18 [Gammaproteobacteria bacterium]|nr:50S ribosomal protein L18 [Gammaproteobacteria bacterium]
MSDRTKRKVRARIKSSRSDRIRLVVRRTNQHIYAQLVDLSDKTLCEVSTMTKSLKIKYGSNIEAAKKVGQEVAKIAHKLGIEKLAFDRSSFRYHGRVAALAEGVRENGKVEM